jgi:biopolymer transport protein ExbD
MKRKILQLLILILLNFLSSEFSTIQAQSPKFRLPAFVRNATEDTNVNKDSALQFTLLQNGSLYYKDALIDSKIVEKTINQHFDSFMPVRQAYIKGDLDAKIGKLLELSKGLYKTAEITDIRLVVIPYKLVIIPSEDVQETLERSRKGYTLNLRLSSKEIDKKDESDAKEEGTGYGRGSGRGVGITADDEPPIPVIGLPDSMKKPASIKLPPKKPFKLTSLVITQNSNRKLQLNGVIKSEKDLLIAVEKQFKGREANSIYRSGTNETDKSVYLKISRDLELRYLIGLLDSLYGIGANRVYLKTDEVAK